MARINIFLSDEQLQTFDRQAKAEGISRSALIQKAMEVYLEKIRQEEEEARRRVQMVEACRSMDKLAEKLGDWDPTPIIRFYRDTRYGPQWGKTRTNPEYKTKSQRRTA
jgi:hypothetical protein